MEFQRLYFFTASILEWKPLLQKDKYKKILTDSLHHLSEIKKVAVYAFVIMPNHIHLILELLSKNGKETPHTSFMKFTAHELLKDIRITNPTLLHQFEVDKTSRKHQFWQRDALATELYSPEVVHQKLNYIHNNPCQGKWMLSESPILYQYSSSRFYESGQDDFGFLKHIGDRL